MTFTQKDGDPVQALMAMSASTTKQLRISHWTSKEVKQFEAGIAQVNSDMKQLKKFIPSKKVSEIVRHFVVWKMQRIKADLDALQESKPVSTPSTGSSKSKTNGANGTSAAAAAAAAASASPAPPKPTTSRAVSPSLSVYGDSAPLVRQRAAPCARPPRVRSGTKSRVAGHRVLCVNCGLYWRKYAAETFNPDLVSVNTRNKANTASATSLAASEDGLGVAPPAKLARTSKDGTKATTPGTGSSPAPTSAPAAAVPVVVAKPEPLKCVMCKRIEPKKKLAQCRQCSLSVHQGCYGLTDGEIEMDYWLCDPCGNEQTQECALLPRCILCSGKAQEDAAAISAKYAAAAASSGEKQRGRPKASAIAAAAAAAAEGVKQEYSSAANASGAVISATIKAP